MALHSTSPQAYSRVLAKNRAIQGVLDERKVRNEGGDFGGQSIVGKKKHLIKWSPWSDGSVNSLELEDSSALWRQLPPTAETAETARTAEKRMEEKLPPSPSSASRPGTTDLSVKIRMDGREWGKNAKIVFGESQPSQLRAFPALDYLAIGGGLPGSLSPAAASMQSLFARGSCTRTPVSQQRRGNVQTAFPQRMSFTAMIKARQKSRRKPLSAVEKRKHRHGTMRKSASGFISNAARAATTSAGNSRQVKLKDANAKQQAKKLKAKAFRLALELKKVMQKKKEEKQAMLEDSRIWREELEARERLKKPLTPPQNCHIPKNLSPHLHTSHPNFTAFFPGDPDDSTAKTLSHTRLSSYLWNRQEGENVEALPAQTQNSKFDTDFTLLPSENKRGKLRTHLALSSWERQMKEAGAMQQLSLTLKDVGDRRIRSRARPIYVSRRNEWLSHG